MKIAILILLAVPAASTFAAWWSTKLLARHEEGVWTRSGKAIKTEGYCRVFENGLRSASE